MSAIELSELIPPELLMFALTEPSVQQDKEIDITGDKLILLYNDVERLSKIKNPETRADAKKLLAFKIMIKSLGWSASFVDMLLNYQIYKDWDRVATLLKDQKGVKYLSPYIEKWLEKGFAPERYNFSIKETKIGSLVSEVNLFNEKLNEGMNELEVHNLVYAVARESKVSPDDLFKVIYEAVIGKGKGPRMGKLLVAIGIKKVKKMLSFATSR